MFLQKAVSNLLKKFKNTVPWRYVIRDLKGEEIVGMFYVKKLQKTNRKEFSIEKIIKRKSNKLYATWKGYDSLIMQQQQI